MTRSYFVAVFSCVVLALSLLLGVNAPAQQPFVQTNDIRFTIRTDQRQFAIGEPIEIRYKITNISNAALFIPRTQWSVICGQPPHFWAWLEDSSGKHYVPGYGGSCLGSIEQEKISMADRMKNDAVLLKPGRSITGSFSFVSKMYAHGLKPGEYRLEAMVYGWNIHYTDTQLGELSKLVAPFLSGQLPATTTVALR